MTLPGNVGPGHGWTPADRGNLPDRRRDLDKRFDDLQANWGDRSWAHQHWSGPNGFDINHFGFWGPNGYWGHTAVWGPGGGAWMHTGYFGPAGYWSRSWRWYNGYCPAWGHGRWNYLWNQYPVAMGFGATMWGINVVNYAFGVGSYYNPYYVAPVYVVNQPVAVYDKPIVGDPSYETQAAATADAAAAVETPAAPDPLADAFDQARQAFYDRQFDQALALTNQALALAPQDAAINEFRSLCLFAAGQYQEAAATIHAVLAAGPGWDWTTMISLYADPATYTEQLRKLEAAVQANAQAADTRFLLGYHYLTMNHPPEAAAQWKGVVQLQPEDKLAAQLVKMYEPESTAESSVPAPPAPELGQSAYPLEKLQGDWTARRDEGEFKLQLAADDSFTWTFTRDGQPQSVSGVFAVRGQNLVMQPDSGGTMLSTITLKDDKTLEFAAIGDAQTLTFTR